MREFDWIDRYLRPLTLGFEGSFNLKDDTALLQAPQGLLVTTDTMVSGIHFIGNEPPSLIARKLMRVNLSDLAASGATPHAYTLNLSLPGECDESWMQAFTSGLAEDQQLYALHLVGGDTTLSPQALVLTITAFGIPGTHGVKHRNRATPHQDIWVTGTLGDAALGLKCAHGALTGPSGHWLNRYRLPEPRLLAAHMLASYIQASIDISDGLMADMRHICAASNVGAAIARNTLPLHEDTQRLLNELPEYWPSIVAAGDDYELLFTARPKDAENIRLAAKKLPHAVTRIGRTTAEANSLHLLDDSGKPIALLREGYVHRG